MYDYFDSLAHPTLDGLWIDGKKGLSFSEYDAILVQRPNLIGSVVCGLPGVGSFAYEPFFNACQNLTSNKYIFPVAPIESIKNIKSQLNKIKEIGFKGIKIHSRLLNAEYSSDVLNETFAVANKLEMPIFLCTFCYSKNSNQTTIDLYKLIVNALKTTPKLNLILVHAGVHDLMLYYELARQAESVMLDLSYTLLKYESIYFDKFRFLFSQFDRKLLIGTDSPEFNYDQLETEFNSLFDGIKIEKVNNICSGNMCKIYEKFNFK